MRGPAHAQRIAQAIGCAAALVLALGPGAAAVFAASDAQVTSFNASVSNNVAGAHPDLTVSFTIPLNGATNIELADAIIDGPPGLLGDPTATPERCTGEQLDAGSGGITGCPVDSQVGVATVTLGNVSASQSYPVYNMVARSDEAARLGFFVVGALVPTEVSVIPRSAGDFGLHSSGALQGEILTSLVLTLWGVPAGQSHDSQRAPCLENGGSCPASWPAKPLLVNPTKCDGPDLVTTLNADFWGDLGNFQTLTSTSAPPVDCGQLPFDPTLSLVPTTTEVDQPTGLAVDVHLPQNDDPNGVGTSALREAVVTLPAGVTLSPSAATRLEGCTDAELGLGSNARPTCPADSQIGTTEIDTPLLPDPLLGTLYLGTPLNNDPMSGQMYRIFQVASGHGMTIKLVGNTVADPNTGQLTTTFDNLPQAPFSDFKLFFKGGSTAPLANPLTCQVNTTTSDFTPFALNGDKFPTSSFTTSFDGAGAPCPATPPFAPQFDAGSTSTQAGGDTGFVLNLTRPDGNQYLSGLTVTTPPGLAARLPAVPLCPLAQAAAGTCPDSSLIGPVHALSGTGSAPLSLPGRVYLAQPSRPGDVADLSVVVPAIAGPYSLGNVVVLAHVHVDPTDAHLTVTSDPLPTILDGIPLRIHAIQLDIDHPGFMVNPTSCTPMAITGTLSSRGGLTATVTSRFQVGGCGELPFKPSFTASTLGHTSKQDGASLKVKIASAGIGQAGIAKVDLTIPAILPSRLTTLQKACTEAQFNANPAGCPSASNIATASIHTPLLPDPLSGPVYFVSHGGAAFPDTEIVLQGDGVELVLDGHTQITKGVTYSRFEAVPDAPFTSFEFNAAEGPYSIFGANGNLCQTEVRMPTSITAQNGAVLTQSTLVEPEGCPNTLTILSHTVKKRTLTLKVAVPGAGKLTATGRGLSKTSKSAKGRGTLTLTLKATGRGRLKTKVKLTFAPSKGRQLTAAIAAQFKR